MTGGHHIDSDLDIAIEIIPQQGDANSLTTWIAEGKTWREQLNDLLPYDIDLEWFDETETPTVGKGIKEGAVLLYADKTE